MTNPSVGSSKRNYTHILFNIEVNKGHFIATQSTKTEFTDTNRNNPPSGFEYLFHQMFLLTH